MQNVLSRIALAGAIISVGIQPTLVHATNPTNEIVKKIVTEGAKVALVGAAAAGAAAGAAVVTVAGGAGAGSVVGGMKSYQLSRDYFVENNTFESPLAMKAAAGTLGGFGAIGGGVAGGVGTCGALRLALTIGSNKTLRTGLKVGGVVAPLSYIAYNEWQKSQSESDLK